MPAALFMLIFFQMFVVLYLVYKNKCMCRFPLAAQNGCDK